MLEEDQCMNIKRSDKSYVIISLYIDDIELTGNDIMMVGNTK